MSQTYGKTSWKRFALVMVPSVAATAAIGVGLANNALAASFSVSGQQFKVSVADLDGTNFAQYGDVDSGPAGAHPIAVSAFDHATIQKLCQSVPTNLGPLGTWVLKLNAGDDPSKPVQADNLMIGLDSLNADATFDNPNAANDGKAGINIGQDASTLAGNAKGRVGGFGQAAPHAHLTGVQQTAWSTSAGTFKLAGLHLSISKADKPGDGECF
ncbi:hypothetical protein CFP65_5019 [Kitasatospora sp. MMS16-BH015]|uniref:DUF6230 family protein n=1 Tax=Kitasatospora sp. MMS16-BH015 TaxID=2018025 RepID=UPI000CA34F07|nr:DUF6230 family protein [Kitasatospora sp. MMS16-BH015]AUG79732.1 hypothetical protein CFP65_5019 [Kitasatospora sp. MMS16-BH015]